MKNVRKIKQWWEGWHEEHYTYVAIINSLSLGAGGIFSLMEWVDGLQRAADGSTFSLLLFLFITGNLLIIYQFIVNYLLAFLGMFLISLLPYLLGKYIYTLRQGKVEKKSRGVVCATPLNTQRLMESYEKEYPEEAALEKKKLEELDKKILTEIRRKQEIKRIAIWLPTAVILSFAYQGGGPIFNPEYILGLFIMSVIINVPGIFIGALVSKAINGSPERKTTIKYYVAAAINILLIMIRIF